VDAQTVQEFLDLKSAMGLAVEDPKIPEKTQDQLVTFFEYGNSIEFSLQEQRRKIYQNEASPEALTEAMGMLSNMMEEFNSIARKLLRRVENHKSINSKH
jgi:hypothetical protein